MILIRQYKIRHYSPNVKQFRNNLKMLNVKGYQAQFHKIFIVLNCQLFPNSLIYEKTNRCTNPYANVDHTVGVNSCPAP